MTISRIGIENIRGFEKEILEIPLAPNFTNIVVAPNGFGKSSISTAFLCAKHRSLIVPDQDKHKGQTNLPSTLKVKYNQTWLEADNTKNEIFSTFDINVIKSNIEPKAKLPKINGVTVAKPYLEISDLDLGPASRREILAYNKEEIISSYNIARKLIHNLETILADNRLKQEILDNFSSISKLPQIKTAEYFKNITTTCRSLVGTRSEISKIVETQFSAQLTNFPHLHSIFTILQKYSPDYSWLDIVFSCRQLLDLYETDRTNLKYWLQYGAYRLKLDSLKDFVRDINATWVSALVREKKGRIVIKFPNATSLSNGQRDLLYFCCNFLKARDCGYGKPCLLIIDEVFDYLDDANIVVAQYFLSTLIEQYKKNSGVIYIVLLTHLDPVYFRGYALKKQKTVHLGSASQAITNTMKAVILERGNIIWSEFISKYFLHYHPDNYDLSNIFNKSFGLPIRHGNSHGFYAFLNQEWKKCVDGSGEYDHFAVCAHVRVQIESCAFGKLENQTQIDVFLSTNGTTNKLDYAESVGISVPEVCFLLAGLYNSGLHQKNSLEQSSSIALKLKNLGLQGLIKRAIAW